MLQKLLSAKTPAILWQGNDGFLLYDGQHLIATDLDFTLGERILPPTVSMQELAHRLDLLFITHGHEDHFSTGTVKQLLEGDRCGFVIPESCREKTENIPGLKERAYFCKPGDEMTLNTIPVRCIRALHGHIGGSIYSGASLTDCGYRFTFGGLSFYQPGDTVLLEEHLDMQGVDVLFLSPTEHNLGVQNALKLMRLLSPKYVILQHHTTYHEHPDNLFWAHGFVEEVLAAMSDEERNKCIVPDMNTVYTL